MKLLNLFFVVGTFSLSNLCFADVSGFFNGTVSYHFENRSLGNNVGASNIDFFLGYDHLLSAENNIFVGGRMGIYREEVLTSLPVTGVHSRFVFGTQGYKYFEITPDFGFKAGLAVDLMVGIPNSALALYAGALGGARFFIQPNFYIEVPFEVGTWPAFDDIGIFTKFGLQFGYSF